MTLKELAAAIGAEVVGGDPDVADLRRSTRWRTRRRGRSASSPTRGTSGCWRRRAPRRSSSPAACAATAWRCCATADPYYAFSQAVVKLHGYRRHPHDGIHPAAHVDPTATRRRRHGDLPRRLRRPAGADRAGLHPVPQRRGVRRLRAGRPGDRSTPTASIGHDGFGFATHKEPGGEALHHKIPQVGNVVIEDDVELGAGCAIDRATLGSTVIGKGTKFSNLVSIGHGARIGPHGLLVGLVGIAGSVKIGHHVTLAGQVGIAGHMEIGDGVTVGAQSGVINDVPDGATLVGLARRCPRRRRGGCTRSSSSCRNCWSGSKDSWSRRGVRKCCDYD